MSGDEILEPSMESLENITLSSSELIINDDNEREVLYDNPILSRVLNTAGFPIYLATFPSRTDQAAIKLFPYIACQPDPCFFNEIKFSELKHTNVILILHHETKRYVDLEKSNIETSCIFMELAPYGHFHDILASRNVYMDEALARTYFHQLIEGLEYLHSNGISHLNLQPANLFLGENYILKIANFDQAYLRGQGRIYSKGTECFRSPEIRKSSCRDPEAADIYSAGIILFVLKCTGTLPFLENGKNYQCDLLKVFQTDPPLFWSSHCKIQDCSPSFFDDDFKELFTSMAASSPEKRPNIKQIKSSKWYNGPIYSQEEVEIIMDSMLRKTEIFESSTSADFQKIKTCLSTL